MKHYDIIIIGSGWGTKLRSVADDGKTVAIIEKSELGGTCLNRGCIPSKMLIYPSDFATHVKEDASNLHVQGIENPNIDFAALVKDTNERISKDSESIAPFYEKNENITLYRGTATFVDNSTVEVNGEQITGEKIYIATGSVPQIPNIPGLADTPYMTSKEALQNEKLPKKMIVIGGGYIAVELWHVYGAAGCEIHFLVRSSMIKNEDKDIREVFQKDFADRYNVHFWISPTKVEYKDGIFYVTVTDKDGNEEIMESDALFVATGVIPMTHRLGLENTDITVSKRWYIEVDEYLETKTSWVYALWDVVGNYLFRHSVNFEGEYLLKQHYLWQEKAPIKYPPMPHAIFSYPQIAGVWYTEDDLIKQGKKKGIDYETASVDYKNSAMGSAMKSEVGFVKMIADRNTRKVLGAHMIWEKSSDIIHMMIVIISAWETIDFMLDKMIFIHPALSEVIRNAARKLNTSIS